MDKDAFRNVHHCGLMNTGLDQSQLLSETAADFLSPLSFPANGTLSCLHYSGQFGRFR